MSMRLAARYVSRRLSSGGKVLSEEEKAAENIYIKKMEQEKLEKLARKGPKPEEKSASSGGGGNGGLVADAKSSASASASASASSGASSTTTEKISTDKNRNYAVVAGVVTGLAALGWYLKASKKKPEEVQD